MEEKQWRRWGGIAALTVPVGYVAIIPLFARVGAPPASGAAWFRYLPGKSAVWWAILWLSVATDLGYLPVAWALYFGLREAGRAPAGMAALLLHVFVVLDLAVTWTHHASMLALYQSYTAASDPAQRAAYLAAAEYAGAMPGTRLLIAYAIVIPSLGILLASLGMRRTFFGGWCAYSGLITGVLGILAISGYYPLIIGNALGATVWFLLVGLRLLRHPAA